MDKRLKEEEKLLKKLAIFSIGYIGRDKTS